MTKQVARLGREVTLSKLGRNWDIRVKEGEEERVHEGVGFRSALRLILLVNVLQSHREATIHAQTFGWVANVKPVPHICPTV